MAAFVKKSGAWAVRIRLKNRPEIFRGGFRTKQDAKDWAGDIEPQLRNAHGMRGVGPTQTTLAQALHEYAHLVTATQAGCVPVLSKLNKYFRAAGLPELKAVKTAGGRVFGLDASGLPIATSQKVEPAAFELVETRAQREFTGARQAGFAKRKAEIDQRGAEAQAVRNVIANLRVSELEGHHFEALLAAMRKGGYAPNTQRQEVAILSGFFAHAIKTWNWPLSKNPALACDWPTQTGRERVMTHAESERVAAALSRCRNERFAKYIIFALETADLAPKKRTPC